jgi:hypothetical protein
VLFGSVDELSNGDPCGFPIKLADFITALGFPLRNSTYDVLEILFQFGDHFLYFFPLFFGPLTELVRRDWLAVADGARAKPIGVRRMAMSCAAAFSCRAEKPQLALAGMSDR